MVTTAPNLAGWLADEHGPDLDDGLFRTHFECLPGPAYIWKRERGSEFVLIAFNRAAAAAIGEARHVLGMTARQLLKNLPGAEEALYRCAERREILVDEADVRLPTATRRMVSTLLPLSASVVVVHMEDVTDRRATEAAVAASERRFRALFQSHPDLVFRMNVAGDYLDVHVPEGAALPLPAEQLLGRNIADVVGAEAAAQHWHYAREALRTEELQTLEYDVEIAGRMRHVESRLLKSGNDEVVVNIRDITERAELEQALTDAREREHMRLGAGLEERLAQIDANVAQLKAALASDTNGAASDAIAALEASVRRADEMVHDLVPVAEGTPLVTALSELVARTAQSHAVSCRLSRSSGVPPMTTETPDLYRIAQEAIANAVEHGHATEIEVICGVVNRNLVLNVIDNGQGFRLAAADNAGAGMRIMAHRARRLGGSLTRSRRAGGGTMVTCTCPLGEPS